MAGGRQQDATEELRRRIQELEQELERINTHHASNTTMLENRVYGLKQGKKNELHQSSEDRLDIWGEIEDLRQYLEATEDSTPTVYYSFPDADQEQKWRLTVVEAFRTILGSSVQVEQFGSSTPRNAPVFVCHYVTTGRTPPNSHNFFETLSNLKKRQTGQIFITGLRLTGRNVNAEKFKFQGTEFEGTEYIEFQFDAMTNFPKELLTSNVKREMERVRECVGISARSSQPVPSALTTGNSQFLQKYLHPAAMQSDVSRQPTDDEDVRDMNRRLKEQLQSAEEAIQMFRETIDEQGETIETLRSEINNMAWQMEEVKRDKEETDRSCREFRRKYLSALDTIERLNDELKKPGSTDVYYAPVQQSHTRLSDECEDLKRDVASMQQYFAGSKKGTVPASLTSGRFKFVWDYLQQTALPAAAAPQQENPALQQEISSIEQFFKSALQGTVSVSYHCSNNDRRFDKRDYEEHVKTALKQALGPHAIIIPYNKDTTLPTIPVFVCYEFRRYIYGNRFDDLFELWKDAKQIFNAGKKNVYCLGLGNTDQYTPRMAFDSFPLTSDSKYSNVEYVELQFKYQEKGIFLHAVSQTGTQRLREIVGSVTKRPDVPDALTRGTFKFVWDYMQTIMPPT